jgi:hypothetical protein
MKWNESRLLSLRLESSSNDDGGDDGGDDAANQLIQNEDVTDR